MTRKEAIEVFNEPTKHIQLLKGKIVYSQFFVEAMEMAITALEQQPCEDAVSRDAIRQGMLKYGFTAPDMTVHEFVEDELPSVTQKSGYWIITPLSVTGRHYQCSECKYIHTFTNFEYCPKCGAKMIEP